MWLSKLFKRRRNQRYDIEETEEYAEEELTQEEEITEIKFVYFALDKPKDDILNSITKNIQVGYSFQLIENNQLYYFRHLL